MPETTIDFHQRLTLDLYPDKAYSIGIVTTLSGQPESFFTVMHEKHTHLPDWTNRYPGFENDESAGLGPIAQAVKARGFDEIVLISNFSSEVNAAYSTWLNQLSDASISPHEEKLTGPTKFGEEPEIRMRMDRNDEPRNPRQTDI